MTARLRLRWLRLELRCWIALMSLCEELGFAKGGFYFWIVRRAASCNLWRK